MLNQLGIRTTDDLSRQDPTALALRPEVVGFWDPSFRTQISMIINFARAQVTRKALRLGSEPLFPENERFHVLDLEYDPDTTRLFLIGILTPEGRTVQYFIDDDSQEQATVEEFFRSWCSPGNLFLTYGNADKSILRKWLGLHPTLASILPRTLDMHTSVIFTQKEETQRIFLPLKSLTAKSVSDFFGFRDETSSGIVDGYDALLGYHNYRRTRDERLRRALLSYNESDLRRTLFILENLRRINSM